MTPEEQQIARMINEGVDAQSKIIYEQVNQLLTERFAAHENILTERMGMAIKELAAATESKTDLDAERKHWIRIFAANIVQRDTVGNAVKFSNELWDALEAEFAKEKVVH